MVVDVSKTAVEVRPAEHVAFIFRAILACSPYFPARFPLRLRDPDLVYLTSASFYPKLELKLFGHHENLSL